MDPRLESQWMLTRRHLLGKAATGVGAAAFGTLLGRDLVAAPSAGHPHPSGGLPGLPHHAAKAKRIIYLTQSGAPSQVDMFDYKPGLAKLRGQELPESVHRGQRLTTMTSGQKRKAIQPSKYAFKQYGASGTWASELVPEMGAIGDDLCFIKTMNTEAINHAPGMTMLLTGAQQPGRPSTGAWLAYGLGSLNDDLPSFVVMMSRDRHGTCGQLLFDYYWGAGFLPSKHQGVKFRAGGDPVLYMSDPPGINRDLRRGFLDELAAMNEIKQRDVGDPEILTRIAQYEMAFKMQTSVPELTDLSGEPAHVLDMYGPDVKRPGSYAANCLLARRLAERGVRFIQLFHVGWDVHKNLETELPMQCQDTDRASAALVKDLKQRGLLDDTLVVWGGEFGRTVFSQGDLDSTRYGRDHHPRCFTMWLAGGGVKPGLSYGQTCDFSYNVVDKPVHVHDLQATLLHQLGIDHERLTFRYQGRNFRLTDVAGQVVRDVLNT